MKSLKILFVIICFFLAVLLFHFFMLLFFWDSFPIGNPSMSDSFKWTSYIHILTSIIYFLAFLLIALSIWSLLTRGYFIKTIATNLKRSGLLFVISGIIQMVLDILHITNEGLQILDQYFITIFLSLLLLVFGLTILSIHSILLKGITLQQENELTI